MEPYKTTKTKYGFFKHYFIVFISALDQSYTYKLFMLSKDANLCVSPK